MGANITDYPNIHPTPVKVCKIPQANERDRPAFIALLLILMVFPGLILSVLHPVTVFFSVFSGFAIVSGAYAVLRIFALKCQKPQSFTPDSTITINDLPRVSILLPLYKEEHMVDPLSRHIKATQYPPDKYEVIFICEPDDTPTIEMARKFSKPPFKLFITQGNGPKTKPNALNAALPHTTGEIITVYDAEDRPDPWQLHAAAQALRQNPELAVVQAPLDCYNADHTWLTRQFALEYAALFHVWIPFLSRLGLPFPLGGTSNHIRRKALEDSGGWDAYNVTEDADLSFRFAAQNWSLGYITPPTREEAVHAFPAWHNQRSRWMKGYMQTWASHMRRPWAPASPGTRRQAFRRQFTLQLTLGLTLLSGLMHVPGILILYAAWTAELQDFTLQGIGGIFMGCLSLSYAAGIWIGAVGAKRAGLTPTVFSLMTMPLYWLLLFPPTSRALWELWRKPFYWNKTSHGVTGAKLHHDLSHVT